FGGPLDGTELLLEVLARAPLTFSVPQAPLSELLARAGVELDESGDKVDHLGPMAHDLADLDDLDDLDEGEGADLDDEQRACLPGRGLRAR
ncbi:MAG: hypothetical protein ACR2KP_21180, partial [Egibacteraceae bacterium]